MLSLESTYPPTYQLALDMLKVQLILILHRHVLGMSSIFDEVSCFSKDSARANPYY